MVYKYGYDTLIWYFWDISNFKVVMGSVPLKLHVYQIRVAFDASIDYGSEWIRKCMHYMMVVVVVLSILLPARYIYDYRARSPLQMRISPRRNKRRTRCRQWFWNPDAINDLKKNRCRHWNCPMTPGKSRGVLWVIMPHRFGNWNIISNVSECLTITTIFATKC